MKKNIILLISVLTILSMLLVLGGCGSSIQDDWDTVLLNEKLPTPDKGNLRIGSNLDNGFYGGIESVDEDYFVEYKKACVEMGYIVESKETGFMYDAFDEDGYSLALNFYDKEISISLVAPEELSEFVWPKTGLAARLPVPESTMCKVTSDSSKSFKIIVGEMTIDDFDEYIEKCKKKGFEIDYLKQETIYSAEDSEGYRLNITYLGCNRVDIMLQTPKDKESITETESSAIEQSSNGEMNSDFVEAMDSYEAFIDEYVDFMKRYSSNPSDVNLLAEYSDYLTKYTELCEDFAKWEDEDLNKEELAYYIEVQGRVSAKILEITQ